MGERLPPAPRFKIDYFGKYRIALYARRPRLFGLLGDKWEVISELHYPSEQAYEVLERQLKQVRDIPRYYD